MASRSVRERIAPLTHLERFRNDTRFESARQTGTITAMDLKTLDPGYVSQLGPGSGLAFAMRTFSCGRSATPSIRPRYRVAGEDLALV